MDSASQDASSAECHLINRVAWLDACAEDSRSGSHGKTELYFCRIFVAISGALPCAISFAILTPTARSGAHADATHASAAMAATPRVRTERGGAKT